ncbi:MAG: GIY-YIG nuclease family protein [Candidatus Thermoplasmatota archaeon]|nr:GIY-YIG nuclease family protein [Candidatus Thermoplasmatota archaeon]
MEWFSVPGYEHIPDPSKVNASADYILLLELEEDICVVIGALGEIGLRRGWYAYCGSAKAGLWGRVKRHLSDPVKKRWHIDHITPHASDRKVLWREYQEGLECRTASYLSKRYEAVKGFGSSDCGCRSHLFFLGDGFKARRGRSPRR